MSDQFALVIDGLQHLDSIDDLPDRIVTAARRAVNLAANRGYAAVGRQIRREVNFPAGYVTGKDARMKISKVATQRDLEAIITARSRPTSLARFVTGSLAVGGANRKAGLRVEVRPGSARRMPGAFLIRLRAGSASLDTQHNLGLAVRTKDGHAPPGYKPLPLGKNLWLLYGPSVASVLYSERNRGGVATDLSPKILDQLEAEFIRQMDLD